MTRSATLPPHTPPTTAFPRGPASWPVLGASPAFSTDQLGYATRMQREFGQAATVRLLGNFTLVMLFDPAYIRSVLTENPRNFTSREFNFVLKSLLGNGLLNIDGEHHRQQRRFVQPAFHKKRVESYAAIMTQHTQEMLATWQRGEVRNVAEELQSLTLRIVAKSLFDVDLQTHSRDLGQAFSDVILFPNGRMLSWKKWLRIDADFTPYGRFMRGIRTLDQTVFDLIAERRQNPRDTGDVLSMLLAAQDDDGTVMTDQQIRDEVMTLFAAGHETTANNLAWTLYLLAQYPEAMATLCAEVHTVLGDRTATIEDVAQLPYTDMVIKESLRLFPPAWGIGRRATEPFTLGEWRLPAGQFVLMSQWVTHRMPEIWGADAAEFRPERFDPAHPQDVPQFAYFPFGGGPRMCIGMPFAHLEARLLLATIVQQFQPKLVPGFRVVPDPMITIRPKYGLQMVLDQAL